MLPQPLSLPQPIAKPDTYDLVMYKPKSAFWLYFIPGSVQLFDLGNMPDDIQKVLGIEPGSYWLPCPEELQAQPGVNGVAADPGWTIEQTLAYGHKGATTPEAQRAGMVMLEAWHLVEAPFVPPGVQPGPLLRKQGVVWQGAAGARYMTLFERLEASAPNRPATLICNQLYLGCWIAKLVLEGVISPASEAIVKEQRRRYQGRILRHQAESGLSPDIREERVERAKDQFAEVDRADVLTEGTPEEQEKEASARQAAEETRGRLEAAAEQAKAEAKARAEAEKAK